MTSTMKEALVLGRAEETGDGGGCASGRVDGD